MPQLAERLPELLHAGLPWQTGIDPIGQGWNLVAQGQPELAIRMMGMTLEVPGALGDWQPLISQARERLKLLKGLARSAQTESTRVTKHADEAITAMDKAKDGLETAANQAGLFITASFSDATNALFKEDAERNQGESATAWKAGLTVLSAAAFVAVLPLLLHYQGAGPNYSTTAQLGAHIASTLALATIAGVLLARARSRDLAAQRANDLSTAMGTMISYSNQISDPAEKERFMMTMGQLVLQAHLTAGSGHSANEESLAGLMALVNLIRPAAPPPAAGG